MIGRLIKNGGEHSQIDLLIGFIPIEILHGNLTGSQNFPRATQDRGSDWLEPGPGRQPFHPLRIQ